MKEELFASTIMSNEKQTPGASVERRLLGIVIAIPFAVFTGFVAFLIMGVLLPHGKVWQIPTMFFCCFIVAAIAGLSCMRAVASNCCKQAHSDQPHQEGID